ncbi:hypothetical protein TrRE_jg2868 [Triparma retinervis]|uniref:Uncharacterized protein n=1 Tax=Triparma retinervis TaxID=2557542 RepID=A0A9W7A5D6_9STRA|nr:hypothetical protein TrRE_jg2868 [Triparma retinervis]
MIAPTCRNALTGAIISGGDLFVSRTSLFTSTLCLLSPGPPSLSLNVLDPSPPGVSGWLSTTVDSCGECRGFEYVGRGGEGVEGKVIERGRTKGVKVARVVKGVFEKTLVNLVDV